MKEFELNSSKKEKNKSISSYELLRFNNEIEAITQQNEQLLTTNDETNKRTKNKEKKRA